jgi:hypothetical protein
MREIKRTFIIKDIDGAGYLCRGRYGYYLSRDFKDSDLLRIQELYKAEELIKSIELFEDLEDSYPVLALILQEIYE